MTNDNSTPSKFSPFNFTTPSKSKSKSKPTPLNNDLSLLVDIMYYDFILFKMVEVYRNNDQILLDEYYQIVKILFKKFKNNNITLDLQISLKILYIQIKKIINENNCYFKSKNKGEKGGNLRLSNNTNDNKGFNNTNKDLNTTNNTINTTNNNNTNTNNINTNKDLNLCCSDHLSLILEKIFYLLCDIKDDHKILLEEKIYKDFLTLISSLIIIYHKENQIDSKRDLINLSSKQMNFNLENYNRIKTSMYLKLGVRQEREFEDKMLKAIDNILEKTFNLLNEPYLYSLTVEKVKGMFNKHKMIFKEENEMMFDKGKDLKDPKDIINPKTPGEKVKWDYKNL